MADLCENEIRSDFLNEYFLNAVFFKRKGKRMLLKRKNHIVPKVSKTDTKSTANAQQNDTKPQANDQQTADTAPTTAEQALIAELSTLTTAGSGFVQPAPVIDSGIWDPPSQPVQAPAIALHESPEAKRIVAFVRACSAAVTHREICGGTGLHFDVVRKLLPALVQSGDLRITEGSESFAHYRLASFTPVPPAPKEPYIHPETAWSNAARERVLAQEAAKRPVPAPRQPEPTDAEIDQMIAADDAKQTTIVLTAEERRWLDEARTRRPVNPQAFLR